jgi:hypothetical protein
VIHRIRACAAALSALAMLGGLAACTSSGDKAGPTSPASGASSKSSTGKSGKAVTIPSQHPLPNPSKISNSVKLRRQVAITRCVSTAGGWRASGNAVNTSGKKPLNVTITVFFTTTKATVLDYAQTKVNVAPGKTGTWTAAAKFKTEPTMRCVLRGVG